MSDNTAKRREELYVVEIDAVKNSEHRTFIEALKCGMANSSDVIHAAMLNCTMRTRTHLMRRIIPCQSELGKMVGHQSVDKSPNPPEVLSSSQAV